eukprot:482765-Rhodomonas_salina.1
MAAAHTDPPQTRACCSSVRFAPLHLGPRTPRACGLHQPRPPHPLQPSPSLPAPVGGSLLGECAPPGRAPRVMDRDGEDGARGGGG